MVEVLASLKPYYYYLIGEGIKKVEIRKSALKAKNWNHKINFYMSKDDKSFAKIPKQFQEKYRTHFGKVGLEVICSKIIDLSYVPTEYLNSPQGTWETTVCEKACLSLEELEKYRDGKRIFGWEITSHSLLYCPRTLFSLTSSDRPPQSYCYTVAEEKENSIF